MSNQIEVIGSLNPEKECQDRVRVLSGGGGICQSLRATDYKDPPKVLVKVSENEWENDCVRDAEPGQQL